MEASIEQINAWRDEHWDEIVADIEALVQVESVEDLTAAREGAPYGPGPREALDRMLEIAARYGLEVHDCEGHIGYADLPGVSESQIGIIGHIDVVPAGPGWTVDPFAVTRREGFLLGRGVIDDKGPITVALHAVRFWAQRLTEKGELPTHAIRVLFGANEETNMKDVAYYRGHYPDPTFLFSPDSKFPLGYGESGICSGTLTSGSLPDGEILEIGGGQAVNAVPGEAWAIVRDGEGGTRRIEAHGTSAHASTPELGVNAIGVLVDMLLDKGVGTAEERAFLELLRVLHGDTRGEACGIACADDHFGPLTMVGGVIARKDGCITQSLDFRYPTTTTSSAIAERVNSMAATMARGATFSMEHDKTPFLMDPDSASVRALLDAYRDVTGEDAKGTTSKGGTYARCFTAGVSFGVEKPWEPTPDWVGGMHGPDEGVSEGLLKQAFSVYARAIGNLMQIALD